MGVYLSKFIDAESTSGSTHDHLENISTLLSHMKNEADVFPGNRISTRYNQLQKILDAIATDLKRIKDCTKKQKHVDSCDKLLVKIQICLECLENRVNHNEEKQNFPENTEIPQPRALIEELTAPIEKINKFLDYLDQKMQTLENDIQRAIETENKEQFSILETKIATLYIDLEFVGTEEHAELNEKKAAIFKRLICCNNKIRKFQKKLETKTNTQGKGKDEIFADNFSKIEHLLDELKKETLAFEGNSDSKKFKKLVHKLETQRTCIYSTEPCGEEETKRKSLACERLKDIEQEIMRRANQTEEQLAASKNIRKIKQDLEGVKKEVKTFRGSITDPIYAKLDEKLCYLLANANEVEEPNEDVKRSKTKVVNHIQYVLKELSEGARTKDISKEAQTKSSSSGAKQNENQQEPVQVIRNLQEPVEEDQQSCHDYFVKTEKVKPSKQNAKARRRAVRDIKSIIEKGKKFRSQVERFSGVYQGLLYRKIEGDLKTFLEEVETVHSGDDEKLQNTKLLAKHKIQTYLRILEIKATRAPIIDQGIHQDQEKPEKESQDEHIAKQEKQNLNASSISVEQQHISILQQQSSSLKKEHLEFENGAAAQSDVIHGQGDRRQTNVADQDSPYQRVNSLRDKLVEVKNETETFSGIYWDKKYLEIEHKLLRYLEELKDIDDMGHKSVIISKEQYVNYIENLLVYFKEKVKFAEMYVDATSKGKVRKATEAKETLLCNKLGETVVETDEITQETIFVSQNFGESSLKQLEVVDSSTDNQLQNSKLLTTQKTQEYIIDFKDNSTKSSDLPISQVQASSKQGLHNKDASKAYFASPKQQNSIPSPLKENQHCVDESASIVPDVQRPELHKQCQTTDADSPHQQINSLRKKLAKVQNKIKQFSGKYVDGEYSKIEDEIIGYFEELKGIDDKGHYTIITTKEQYAEYIKELLQNFKEKANSSEEPQLQSSEEVNIQSECENFAEEGEYKEGLKYQKQNKPKPPIRKPAKSNDLVPRKTHLYCEVFENAAEDLISDKLPRKINPPVEKHTNSNDQREVCIKAEKQVLRKINPPIEKHTNENDQRELHTESILRLQNREEQIPEEITRNEGIKNEKQQFRKINPPIEKYVNTNV